MPTAVVIGGGPAGSSAGASLARRGWRVTIVEKKAFPRLKVCGEFISPAATSILHEFLSAAAMHRLGARRIDELVIEEGERVIRWPLPEPAWVLSRRSLDTALLDAARAEGAEVLKPVGVREVLYRDDGVRVLLESGDAIDAEIVVHADGSGRFDAPKPRGAVRTVPNRRGVLGLKCHIRRPPWLNLSGLHMRSCRGAYIGLVAVEGEMATLALVARSAVVAPFGVDHDALIESLWPGYERGWRSSPWLACAVAGSGYIRPGHPRSFRVGNAAAAVEPVGGEGIGLALWAGSTLADAMDCDDLPGTQARYARAYRARLSIRRPACRLVAELLLRPLLVRALWLLSRPRGPQVPMLGRCYALTGKNS